MSTEPLTTLIVLATAAVVLALFLVMWSGRRIASDTRVALLAGTVLALWATGEGVLAARGTFEQPDGNSIPPVGINLLIVFAGLTAAFLVSGSLRRLFANQKHLIQLNVWRLVGAVFLWLMWEGRMPALWALPAGIGDILVGAASFMVAADVESPKGRRRAVLFNSLGLADLVVAVGLGIMTNPGPAQVFHTIPTSELVTRFPLALVPTFLVPLAVAIHVISLRQLVVGSWSRQSDLEDEDMGARNA